MTSDSDSDFGVQHIMVSLGNPFKPSQNLKVHKLFFCENDHVLVHLYMIMCLLKNTSNICSGTLYYHRVCPFCYVCIPNSESFLFN